VALWFKKYSKKYLSGGRVPFYTEAPQHYPRRRKSHDY
jgi:hypothetical protein